MVLLGESYSGPIALTLATRTGIDVRAVVLVATFSRYPISALKVISRFLPLSLVLRLPIPDFVIRYFCFGDTKDQTLYDELRHSVKSNQPSVLAERARDGASIDVTEQLGLITVPCLYIAASKDRMVPNRAVQHLQGKIKHLCVHQLDGPHFILQTRPRECYELIASFVSENT